MLHGLYSCRQCKDLFSRSKEGRCLIKARIGRDLPQKPSAMQATICTFPSAPVGLVCPFWPRPRGHSLGNIITHLANHLYHMFLRKRTDFSRPHYALHILSPYSKHLQFLKLLSVICVVFILVSPETSCQTTELGNSVVFFPHIFILFFIS